MDRIGPYYIKKPRIKIQAHIPNTILYVCFLSCKNDKKKDKDKVSI